jgi:RHS repeat-associated protein
LPQYGQTLIEKVKNAAGQATQRTSFTFGADEITQTVTTFNPSTGVVTATATRAFGHDGHGSVRVLFDAAAAVNQVFTYSAYGEFLAIHNGAGVRTSGSAAALANPGDALTKQLYNGENLDPRTGLYNFRARWYAVSSGRFERLDPYAGNFGDPQSLHKYLYGHADAVNSIDPNGQWSLGQTMMATTIGGAIAGFSYGVYRAGEETGWELSWKSVTKGLVYGVVGGLIGAGAGALAGLAFHSLIVLPLQGVAAGTVGTGASWTSLLGHFVALAHPTVTVFFGLGFTVGMSLGIASPTSVIAAFSALLLGQTSLDLKQANAESSFA